MGKNSQNFQNSCLQCLKFPCRCIIKANLSFSKSQRPVSQKKSLDQNMNAWKALDPPSFVLEAIKGHFLSFHSRPPLVAASPSLETRVASSQTESLSEAVRELIKKGAIEPAPDNPGFYSRLFTVPKKDGSLRPVINLKPLNMFISVPKFRMASVSTVARMIHDGDWATSLDLKDAFFHVPIHNRHRRFLRFIWKSKPYQFASCPFGLSTAPSTFTRVTRPVLHWCRSQAMRVVFYLDDILILADSPQEATSHCSRLRSLLDRLGFTINLKKSELTPVQSFVYLGLRWDSVQMTVSLPKDKRADIRCCADNLLKTSHLTSRKLLRFLGKANFASIAVPRGRLWCRPIQRCVLKGQSKIFKKVTLSPEARQAVLWWTALRVYHSPLWFPETSQTMTTDASITGWGATLSNKKIKGLWPPSWVQQRSRHINKLEMRAVLLAVQHWRDDLAGHSVQLLVDNITTVLYLKKDGGTKSAMLVRLTKEVSDICLSHDIRLVPCYLPGLANIESDALSRGKTQDEWFLLPLVATKIFRIYEEPDVDLFASKDTAQLTKYFSIDRFDHQSLGVDALAHQWDFGVMYAFPPPSLILSVLQKFRRSTGKLLLIAPFWIDAHWFPELVSLLYREPRRLRYHHNLVVNTTTGLPLPSLNRLRLTVWPLSRPSSQRQASQRKLLNSSLLLGGGLRQSNIGQCGNPGRLGAKAVDWTQLRFL